MVDPVAVVVPFDQLGFIHDALAAVSGCPESVLLALVRASLSRPAAAHWTAQQAALELARAALSKVSADAVNGVKINCMPSDAPVWNAWVAEVAKAMSPLSGPSVTAYCAELEARLASSRLAAEAARPAPPELQPFLDRAEGDIRAAHAELDRRGVPYHPLLVERIRMLAGDI